MHGGNRHVVKRCESCGYAARTTPRTGNTFSLTRLSGNTTNSGWLARRQPADHRQAGVGRRRREGRDSFQGAERRAGEVAGLVGLFV